MLVSSHNSGRSEGYLVTLCVNFGALLVLGSSEVFINCANLSDSVVCLCRRAVV
jgi:hypothetical protein